MIVLIIGTWKAEIAKNYKNFASQIGKELAKRGHKIVSGAGTGMSKLVVEAYKSNKGKEYVAIIPAKEHMEAVGEELGPEPDKIIQKKQWDYPLKNIELVKYCDVVLALPGSLGTLTEVIHAVNDYGKKVAVLDIGELAELIKQIPTLREKVFLSDNIKEIFEFLEKKKK